MQTTVGNGAAVGGLFMFGAKSGAAPRLTGWTGATSALATDRVAPAGLSGIFQVVQLRTVSSQYMRPSDRPGMVQPGGSKADADCK